MPSELIGILMLDGSIDLYSNSLKFITWKLRRQNLRIVKIGCLEALDRCTSINALNNEDFQNIGKQNICKNCIKAQKKLSYDFDFNIEIYKNILSKEDQNFINEVRRILNKTNKIIDVIDIKYKNHNIIKIAFFDFSLKEKINLHSTINLELKEKFISGIKDQIKLLKEFHRFNKLYKISHLIYVNGNYSQNTLARNYFSKLGVINLSVEIQPSSQKILNKFKFVEDRFSMHPEYLFKKLTLKESIQKVSIKDGKTTLRSFEKRINGQEYNAYTTLDKNPRVIKERNKIIEFIKKHNRIHSYFLSSEDEITAHENCFGSLINGKDYFQPSFKSQVEFTDYLIKNAVRYPETGFIIRLHPRMAVNKRNSFESQEHKIYKKLLSKTIIPNNVHIVFGDSKLSSFFIISKSNLIIVAWSSIGLESLLLGKPVISAFPNRAGYPIYNLSNQPKNEKDFVLSIFKKSNFGYPIDKILLSWTHNAYESQFFYNSSPRTTYKLGGRIYELIYKVTIKLKIYGILAWIINILFLRKVVFDSKLLFIKKQVSYPWANFRMKLLENELKKYRKRNLEKLFNY